MAFVVLDPRQEERYWWGIDYFLKVVKVNTVFPMHCWGKYWVIRQFINEKIASGYCHKIINVNQEGECFRI